MPADTPTPLPPSALAVIEARCAAATPGPWTVRAMPRDPEQCFVQARRIDSRMPYDIEVLGEDATGYPTRRADAEFIAAARTDIPALLAEVRRLTAEGERVATAYRALEAAKSLDAEEHESDDFVKCPSCEAWREAEDALNAALAALAALTPTPTPLAATREEPAEYSLPDEAVCECDGCLAWGHAGRKCAICGECVETCEHNTEEEIAHLWSRLAASRLDGEDAARLDWLEREAKQGESVMIGWSREDHDYDEMADRSLDWPESYWVHDETNTDPPHATLRAAIDAAMRTPSPTEGGDRE